jgi:DNA (cytosine-5)-methyltransferase 1
VAATKAGCRVALAVDFDRAACETLRANSRYHERVLETDVATLDGRSLRKAAGLRVRDPLLIVGGPPCQPFSKAAFWFEDGDDAAYRRARARGENAAKPKVQDARKDERRFLIKDFIRLVREARADGFVFENVASLLAPRNRAMLDGFIRSANAAGYKVTTVRASALDYGVPQKRERVFLLGSRTDRAIAPPATHAAEATGRLRPYATVGEALAPYAHPRFAEPEEVVTGRWADHLRSVPPGMNYKAHTAWAGHPNPTFVAETRFWNFLLKLDPNRPSWTIPANPGPWVGPFHWESRRLRTPELAALQGFPADYVFTGSRRERVRQIGNAAPPPLAEPMIRAALAAAFGMDRQLAAA